MIAFLEIWLLLATVQHVVASPVHAPLKTPTELAVFGTGQPSGVQKSTPVVHDDALPGIGNSVQMLERNDRGGWEDDSSPTTSTAAASTSVSPSSFNSASSTDAGPSSGTHNVVSLSTSVLKNGTHTHAIASSKSRISLSLTYQPLSSTSSTAESISHHNTDHGPHSSQRSRRTSTLTILRTTTYWSPTGTKSDMHPQETSKGTTTRATRHHKHKPTSRVRSTLTEKNPELPATTFTTFPIVYSPLTHVAPSSSTKANTSKTHTHETSLPATTASTATSKSQSFAPSMASSATTAPMPTGALPSAVETTATYTAAPLASTPSWVEPEPSTTSATQMTSCSGSMPPIPTAESSRQPQHASSSSGEPSITATPVHWLSTSGASAGQGSTTSTMHLGSASGSVAEQPSSPSTSQWQSTTTPVAGQTSTPSATQAPPSIGSPTTVATTPSQRSSRSIASFSSDVPGVTVVPIDPNTTTLYFTTTVLSGGFTAVVTATATAVLSA